MTTRGSDYNKVMLNYIFFYEKHVLSYV